MSRKSLSLSLLIILSLLLFTSCQSKPTFYNVNTMHTATSFGFTENGEARVSVSYLGYENTTGANIDIKIEKQGFLFFWDTVAEQTLTAQGNDYQNESFYPITENGHYRCTVTYTVFGTGENDVITFKDEKTYRKENAYSETTDTSLTEITSTEVTSTDSISTEATTTESTTTTLITPEIPAISAAEFADRLSLALEEKESYNTEFQLQKTVTIDTQSYHTHILTSIQSDFRNDILYSYFSTANSQMEDFENYYIFIDDTIYISVNGDRYQKPLAQQVFAEKTPRHALSLLFGVRLQDAFANAKITASDDGSMTATLEIPFAVYYDSALALIEFLTNDHFSEQEIHNYWNFIQVAVTLDENGALSDYSFTISYDVLRDELAIPTQYVIQATEKEVDLDNFKKYLPSQEYLSAYPTENPQQPEQPQIPITPPQESLTVEQEEFLALFYDAYEKWNPNRYKLTITSSRKENLSNLFSVDTPLTQAILMDCTNPNEPIYYQQAISSEAAYYAQSDIYFKNDRLYVSDYAKFHLILQIQEEKYSVAMLSDYFLADAQVDWLFFEEDMLNDAEIVKNEDGSVTASMKVSGYGSQFRTLIKATYGDDFSDESLDDFLRSHNVKITIDASGYITKMIVSGQMQVTDTRNGSRTTIHYTFFIEPDYTDFYIDFPDDLDTYEDLTEEYYRE